MNKMTRIFLAAGLLSFAACGDDSLSEEDSQKGFMATNAALAQGGAGAQSAAVQGLLAVDYTYNCIEGGSAKFVGELDDMSQDANTDATFNYTVTFDGCVSQGVSITGEMVYSLDVVASDTDATVEYSYVGNVSFGGDISGDCDLDVYAKFITSNTDTNASVSYEYRGNMCGNDAGSLNASGTINVNIPQT